MVVVVVMEEEEEEDRGKERETGEWSWWSFMALVSPAKALN